MSERPLLSIVMPVFNHAELTRYMIESIRANDFMAWELLVVDDGSDSDTISVLNALAASDDRLQILHRNRLPKGAQTCRNIGFEHVCGEYVIFFDNDDYVLPYCLRSRVMALQARPELDFMVFPSGVMTDNTYRAEASEYSFGYRIHTDDTSAFARRLLPFVVWNNIYRTQSLRNVGICWDEQLLSLQDADFNMQSLLAGLRYDYFRGIPDFGYRIDASNGSVSKKQRSKEHQESTLYAMEKFYRMLSAHHGSNYHSALFFGVLTYYNRIMTNGIDEDYAMRMVRLVRRYSPIYGLLFHIGLQTSLLMERILPRKMARQIPMTLHLIDYRYRIHQKISKIQKLQHT